MKLNKFKDEVYKCSGCGICQSICPVYKVLKQECAVSRGKFKLLNAIINGDIKLSEKTLKIMDLCLHCQACSEFCPSNIDAQKIIETTQSDLLDYGICDYFKLYSIKLLTNKTFMLIIKSIINVFRKYNIIDFISKFNSKKTKLLSELLNIKIQPEISKLTKGKVIKVLYFKGCMNNYINNSTENAVKKILKDTGVKLIEKDFECCGLVLKSAGDFEGFKEIIKKNLKLIGNNIDYLLFDCASCKSTFLKYPDFLEGKEKERAINISNKIVSIYELLNIIDYVPQIKGKQKITFHFPCHIRGTQEIEIIEKLIKKTPEISYVKMEEADSCCGAAGSFILTNPDISKKISINKAENIINTKADIVLTTCPACIMGLKQGLLEKNSDIKTMQFIEFLASNL